jgi:hypothetical protein
VNTWSVNLDGETITLDIPVENRRSPRQSPPRSSKPAESEQCLEKVVGSTTTYSHRKGDSMKTYDNNGKLVGEINHFRTADGKSVTTNTQSTTPTAVARSARTFPFLIRTAR